MTAQFDDTVHFRGNDYGLAGISGGGLFEPTEHGLRPTASCSACWRGFVCGYLVDDNQLWLNNLSINLRPPLPTILNTPPSPPKAEHVLFSGEYKNIRHKLPFSGGLLIARDFVQELYVHMGFHPAWKYRTVFELLIHEGQVLEIHDRSQAMRELRERLVHPREEVEPRSQADIATWVARCFSRKYDD
jgi:hypothetical protein